MFAIIETGGKQYKVEEGSTIKVEKLEGEVSSEIIIDKVLLIVNGDNISVGKPYIKGVTVSSTKVEDGKDKKVITYKYRRRKDWDKKKGHRHQNTVLKINKINI
ncbi:MAG: 50S ribosomal protein L21 [uncultured bacterium]|nr:MAG: 50S ribosomal protein L21 [uncultured bacterium]